MSTRTVAPASRRAALAGRFRAVRAATEALCAPLAVEDHVVQTIEDVSPPRWHLAHTTWFFETFLLAPFEAGFRPHAEHFDWLFNSYYEAVGSRVERARRGQLSRPTVAEVLAYRRAIDERVLALLERGLAERDLERAAAVVELGANHEEQHQELLVTDLKHILASNPARPAYLRAARRAVSGPTALGWRELSGGLVSIGHPGGSFGFDNEFPVHRVWLERFELADRPATNGEFADFVADAGYERPELWLSDGWAAVQRLAWRAPLYWERIDGDWHEATLRGREPLELAAPVCHVSYFEADAFARWSKLRLPTEFEWEHAAHAVEAEREIPRANLLETGELHPRAAGTGSGLRQLLGDVWEWTASAYSPYPGFRPLEGALGEYNGKFMSGQMVLRGGSCATPRAHVRASYRNFFQPEKRWQFTGIRLAR